MSPLPPKSKAETLGTLVSKPISYFSTPDENSVLKHPPEISTEVTTIVQIP